MIQWEVVAAFIGPLVGTMGLIAGFFAWTSKKRETMIRSIVKDAFNALDSRLMLVETALTQQNRQLDQQDSALATAMQSIARIEGRLAERHP